LFRTWLTAEKKEPDKQWFDNFPAAVVKRFPKVQPARITEERLAKQLWWWRKADTDKADTIFHHPNIPHWTEILLGLYRDYFEQSAYYYELRARYRERYAWGFGQPWVYCSREQRRMLGCLWPRPSSHPVRRWTPAEAGRPEWRELIGVKFNLKLNDSVLVEQFTSELKRLRSQLEIPAPKIGTGVRRKPISWLPIELMDIRRYEIRSLNGSERSQVSKAILDYEEVCEETVSP